MKIKQQLVQLLFSQIFTFVNVFIVAFTGVYVNDLIANNPKDPPLKDLFLDNIPEISWVFQISDIIILVLYGIFLALMLFHKQRIQILTRQNLLIGTILLLRTSLVLATTLPAPRNCQCKPFVNTSQIEHLENYWSHSLELVKLRSFYAWKIFLGFGMPFLSQIHSCGDYLFSGHTALITIYCLTILKYMPKHFYLLAVVTWILNIVGVLAILVAHAHYSIDVLVAIFLTTLLFKYNHRKCLLPPVKRGWIPGLCFMKDPFYRKLANEYETLEDLKNNFFLAVKLRLKFVANENVI